MKSVIFDLDGTLADVRHRRHHLNKPAMEIQCCYEHECTLCGGTGGYLQGEKPDWDSWNSEMHLDGLVEGVYEMYLYHKDQGHKIIICTGRFSTYSKVTIDWLEKNNIEPNILLMRPEGNYNSDYVVKKEMLDYLRAIGCNPHLAYDDRDSVVKMWRDQGLTCFQVAEGAF